MILLNSEQQRAVQASGRPTLVVAGAGTGKTRVLIERIIKLINEDGIDPRQILAITFTNKARDEIRSRIEGRIGNSRVPSNIFTFHAFFHKLLKTDIEHLDPRLRNFKVLDEADQRGILRRLLKSMNICTDDFKALDPRSAEDAVGKLKIRSRDLERKEEIAKVAKSAKISSNELLSIYREYQEELSKNLLLDYNDLELYAFRLLDVPEVRRKWKEHFAAILIDEFQDTSELQMDIVKKLADRSSNIFCVGDPDQSIYGWRGAKPKICSEFLEHFGAQCIKLEENYRSTQTILDISNHLILRNHSDKTIYKRLRAAKKPKQETKVVCLRFADEWDEARYVVDEIEHLIKFDPGTRLKDIAILYRTNSCAKVFEIVLKERRIECEVANTVDFFARLEIKFIVHFLRLLYFYDELGVGIYLQTVVEATLKGLGAASCHLFFRFLSDGKMNLKEGIERIDECSALKPPKRKLFLKLWGWIEQLIPHRNDGLVHVVERIIQVTGYADIVQEKNEEGRLENIRQFAEGLSRNEEGLTNKELVDEISLRANSIVGSKADDFVFLSTVHQAKGLEYKYVFVVKMSKGVFPSRRAVKVDDLEEERRLAYVAFTRAKKSLYITSSPVVVRQGPSDGQSREYDLSQFIYEIQGVMGKVEFRDMRRLQRRGLFRPFY